MICFMYRKRVTRRPKLVSHYRIMCLRKNGAALINFVDGRVTDGFILREGEFVTSLQALKEIGIKAGFSAFAEE